jgi:hypothetical protein
MDINLLTTLYRNITLLKPRDLVMLVEIYMTSFALNTYKTKGTYRLAGKFLHKILRK